MKIKELKEFILEMEHRHGNMDDIEIVIRPNGTKKCQVDTVSLSTTFNPKDEYISFWISGNIF